MVEVQTKVLRSTNKKMEEIPREGFLLVGGNGWVSGPRTSESSLLAPIPFLLLSFRGRNTLFRAGKAGCPPVGYSFKEAYETRFTDSPGAPEPRVGTGSSWSQPGWELPWPVDTWAAISQQQDGRPWSQTGSKHLRG